MSEVTTQILIGVDGGGTTCRFALSHAGGRVEHRAGPANVYSDFAKAMQTLTDGLNALAAQAGLADLSRARIYLGLAGVTGPDMAAKVAAALALPQVTVADDRRSAVTGALGTRDGAVLGIGTGTFLARRHRGRVALIGGWGLVLGDEASGAYLGRTLLQTILHVTDGLTPATPLTAAVLESFGGTAAAIVEFARDASPADYATIAPDILAAARAGDDAALALLNDGAAYILRGLDALGWRDGEAICPLGGLASHYSEFLPADVAASFVTPAGTALDGALALAAEVGR
jgi:glucosamine kinase